MKRPHVIYSLLLTLLLALAAVTVIVVDERKQIRLEKRSSELVVQLIRSLGFSWDPGIITSRMVNPPLPGSQEESNMMQLYDVLARHGRLLRIDEAQGQLYVPSVLKFLDTPEANYTLLVSFANQSARIETEMHYIAGDWRLVTFEISSNLLRF